jgi:TrmH family RNA methyltransferase
VSRVLTSTRNARVVELAKLHDPRRRKATGLTLVEGPHQLRDVLDMGATVEEIYALEGDDAFELADDAAIPATAVNQSVLRKIAGTEHPRGPVGIVRIPEPDPLEPVDTVVLWDVRDPGNAGAIIRTATAFGYAVATASGSVDVWSPRVIRAAAATQFGNRIAHVGRRRPTELASLGFTTVATVAVGGDPPDRLVTDHPVALLIGNEAHGLPDDVTAAAVSRVTIPLAGGVESLNAAVAAAVVMYELRR